MFGIEILMQKHEPQFKNKFMEAVDSTRQQIKISDLEDAISSNNENDIFDALDFDNFQNQILHIKQPQLNNFILGAKTLAEDIKLHEVIDLNEIAAKGALEQLGSQLITQISDDTRNAINAKLIHDFDAGIHPRFTARNLREMIGVNNPQQKALNKLQAHLKAEGTSKDVIDKIIARKTKQYIRERADMIARTESAKSINAGRHQMTRQLHDDGALGDSYLMWRTASDERVCAMCAPMNFETTTIDGVFPGGFAYPPAHPRCRCIFVVKFGQMPFKRAA